MDKNIAQKIQMALAENNTAEAFEQLLEQPLSSSWKQTVLVLKGSDFNNTSGM